MTVPVIAGTAQEGQTLTASATARGDDTLSYRWMENSGPNGTYQAIAAATASTYLVKEGDEGFSIEVTAAATNANGVTASQTSAPTSAAVRWRFPVLRCDGHHSVSVDRSKEARL